MNHPVKQVQPYRGNRGIAVFRICLWLLPAFVLPFGASLGLWLEELWFIAIIPTFAAFVAIGYLDMRLKFQQEQGDPTLKKQNIWSWAIVFGLFQVIIAPALAFTVISGICTVTGLGYP